MLNHRMYHMALAGAATVALGAGSALAQDAEPGAGTTIQPVEGPNLEEKFQHQILYRALEELGYEVEEPQEVEYQTVHLALGTGDGDFTAIHWDPLHQVFFEESGGDEVLERVGNLISGALQGYLVDKESHEQGVTNVADLADPEVAARFDANDDGQADLAGCVPGWGCERVIEHHLDEYGLRDTVAHNQGAYNAIMADVIARHESGEPILYYTWTPYWVSGVLVPGEDVEWLEVPYTSLPDERDAETAHEGRNLGFEVNDIIVVARDEFLEENPAAEKLFEVAKIDINDISAQNNKMRAGEDSPEDIANHVETWISDHQEEFDSWVEQARQAAAES